MTGEQIKAMLPEVTADNAVTKLPGAMHDEIKLYNRQPI